MEAHADALPRDYRIVYAEIMQYMWKFTSGDGMDIVATLKDVLGLFETCAAEGKQAWTPPALTSPGHTGRRTDRR